MFSDIQVALLSLGTVFSMKAQNINDSILHPYMHLWKNLLEFSHMRKVTAPMSIPSVKANLQGQLIIQGGLSQE